MVFVMFNEAFVCEHCGAKVPRHPEGSARNHCPFCLYSLHLDDQVPGDRDSECRGLMCPVGIDFRKNKGWMIEHECQVCGKKMLNKVAPDDAFADFVVKIQGEGRK